MSERPEQLAPLPDRRQPMLLTWLSRGTDNEHRDILQGMVWVALFVLVGKLAGAAKEMVVAWRYGVSAEVDAYLFLFNIINWPLSLWGGILTAILVPILAKARSSHLVDDLSRFHAELLGRTIILGVALGAFGAGTLAILLNTTLTGLSPAGLRAAQNMILPLSLLVPLGALVGMFSVSVLSRGNHSNTLLESVPALVIGISVALAGESGIEALTWGTLAGFACHALGLAIPLRADLRAPRWSGRSAHWSAFWTGFSIMLAGQFLMSLTGLVDQFFVTRLAEGALSTLSYAQRILALILGFGATVVGRAMISSFARGPETDQTRLYGVAMRWVRVVFFAGIVAVVAGWWLGPWGVRLLFERGAFTAQDSDAVVAVFRIGLLQLPFNFAAVILFYALAARRQFGELTAIAAIALATKLLANAALVSAWGIEGIMFSTALMYALLMLMYLYVMHRAKCAPA